MGNLSISEYFRKLQIEYLQSEFRYKVYFSAKDKKYYQKVMNFKKEKIENISLRNSLKSIFNDEERLNKFRNELFLESGYPKFEMTKKDIEQYYLVDCDFSYNGEVVKIVDSIVGEKVWVENESGERFLVNLCEINRIF